MYTLRHKDTGTLARFTYTTIQYEEYTTTAFTIGYNEDHPWVVCNEYLARSALISSRQFRGSYEKPHFADNFHPEDWEIVSLKIEA